MIDPRDIEIVEGGHMVQFYLPPPLEFKVEATPHYVIKSYGYNRTNLEIGEAQLEKANNCGYTIGFVTRTADWMELALARPRLPHEETTNVD